MALVKTSRVLERRGSYNQGSYVARDEDTGQVTTDVQLDPDTVADLGDPEQITVTIRPGDCLN